MVRENRMDFISFFNMGPFDSKAMLMKENQDFTVPPYSPDFI